MYPPAFFFPLASWHRPGWRHKGLARWGYQHGGCAKHPVGHAAMRGTPCSSILIGMRHHLSLGTLGEPHFVRRLPVMRSNSKFSASPGTASSAPGLCGPCPARLGCNIPMKKQATGSTHSNRRPFDAPKTLVFHSDTRHFDAPERLISRRPAHKMSHPGCESQAPGRTKCCLATKSCTSFFRAAWMFFDSCFLSFFRFASIRKNAPIYTWHRC